MTNSQKVVIPAKAGIQDKVNRFRKLDSGLRGCVIITESAIKAVIPAKAGIQNLLEILHSVSRFACTE